MTRAGAARRVLVIGKDARTDAIAAACQASPDPVDIYALAEMRTPGLAEKCREVITGSLTDRELLARTVRQVQPELAIMGPEEPLAAGYVDVLQAMGVPAFGPTRKLAAIESSKSWARQLLDRHQIPGNPDYRVFADAVGLRDYMEDLASFVIKPDGLTAGKGVRVFGEHLQTLEEAMGYAEALLATDGSVQIEERLEGQEFSLQTITDGNTVVHCPLVQDHKRAFEGDQGPNTGGMGSYSCPDLSLPFLSRDDVAYAHSINERVIEALALETGEPYQGVLYGGFMAVRDGVRLIEYNARFGDPEAMNVLSILQGDFVEVCHAATSGRLGSVSCSFASSATVFKYVVPADYPETAPHNETISVPEGFRNRTDTRWYWAACEQKGADAYLTSSRSGGFLGIGSSLEEAEQRAERAADAVEGPVRHRTDIGRADAIKARVRHLESLRSDSTALAGAHPS